MDPSETSRRPLGRPMDPDRPLGALSASRWALGDLHAYATVKSN
jgi:hypothetical protein